ncbi:hypothetical protein [Mesorhizobium sp. WSM3860]|uniref:hypothetical protein n=1 Tax=Mesorhizobium sp. WSM3860 TaxID=2029403 RepID=UPI000BD576C9|nr:hypothetical protein [Mesorhizobium sp. WSM3860]PBC05404.1 hypothetical protein CK220_05485 [Mesorhizobium sp. WSM3860]
MIAGGKHIFLKLHATLFAGIHEPIVTTATFLPAPDLPLSGLVGPQIGRKLAIQRCSRQRIGLVDALRRMLAPRAACSYIRANRPALKTRDRGGISCEQGLSSERLIRVLRACLEERLEQWQK